MQNNMGDKTAYIKLKLQQKKEKRQKQWSSSKYKNYHKVEKIRSKAALKQASWRLKQRLQKQTRADYMREYRRKIKLANNMSTPTSPYTFTNRMEKTRSLKKLKTALPQSSKKRAAVLTAYTSQRRISQSPAVKQFHSETDQSQEDACFQDIRQFLSTVKHKKDVQSRATVKLLSSAVNGEHVQRIKCATNLSKKLGIQRRTMYGGKRIRTTVLTSEKSAYDYTKRKTRSDALSDNNKRVAFEFWLQPEISRATNNKNDVKRVRLGPKIYSSHHCHILEKSQTEIFQDFKKKHPEIKIGQRSFEKCKPYFVRPASAKDKSTCCCRVHVETRSLFKSCMTFRKSIKANHSDTEAKIYDSLTELVDDTLCPVSANTHQRKSSCLARQCKDCGIEKFRLMEEETSQDSDDVSWESYEYRMIKNKDGVDVRKLMLVKKKTPPIVMFTHFLELLKTFPSHQFRADWQQKEMKNSINNLPSGQCVVIHDYSENYKCSEKQELQSSYFQKVEASLHISIIHRHATLEVDGQDSTEEHPIVVTEQFIVISPETKHDHHFTHEVQLLVVDYLKSVDNTIETLHEFTDGCSCQYKSCHCLGDMSYSCQDMEMKTVIRNYFETSHGRGPQDAAGGYIMKMADLAVLRGTHVIQTADDLYQFATENLTDTKEQSACSRRIFRQLDNINRDRPERYFVPVKENRKIHQVINSESRSGTIFTRNLSCYDCNECVNGKYLMCKNDCGLLKEVSMAGLNGQEDEGADTHDISIIEDPPIADLVAPGTIVALRAEDNNYPYNLLYASSSVITIRKPITDKWGASFKEGTRVIHGLYYQTHDENYLTQTLIRKLKATVPAQSIVYICSELEYQNSITISESLHRRILKCL